MAAGIKKPHFSYVNGLIGEKNMNATSLYRLSVICGRCLAVFIYSIFVISAFLWLSGIFNCRLLTVGATMYTLLQMTGPISVSSELVHQYLFNGYKARSLSNSAELTQAISSSKSEEMEFCASPPKEVMEENNSVPEKKEKSVAQDADMTAKSGSCADTEQGVDSRKFEVVLVRSLIPHVMLFSSLLPVSAFDLIFKDGFDTSDERYAACLVVILVCNPLCLALILLCLHGEEYFDMMMEEEVRRLEKGKS